MNTSELKVIAIEQWTRIYPRGKKEEDVILRLSFLDSEADPKKDVWGNNDCIRVTIQEKDVSPEVWKRLRQPAIKKLDA